MSGIGRRLALAVVAVGSLLVALPARAATVDVSVDNFSFSPALVRPAQGDTVTWTWSSGATTHNVTAYAGDAFASANTSFPSSYSRDYAGGTVRYRCTLHSSLPGDGTCNGMCGVLTDDPHFDTGPPSASIDELSPVQPSQPFVVSGVASDDQTVSSVDVVATGLTAIVNRETATFTATLQGSGPNVSWTVDVSGLLPGFYSLIAVATDGVGQVGQSSAVSVIVA